MIQSILVVRFSSLGDILLTSPTVINLKIAYPESHLTYLTKEMYRPVVELLDGVDEIETIADRMNSADYYRHLLRLDGRSYSLIVDLHGNPRSWLAGKLVGADRVVRYPKRRVQRRLLTRRRNKQIPTEWPHTIDLYNECLTDIQVPAPASRPIIPARMLRPGATEQRSITRPAIAICPGAQHPNKQWSMDGFVEVARRMHMEHDAFIYWIVTSENPLLSQLAPDLPGEMIEELVDVPIPRLARVLSSADITLANDSGLAHLSSAVGTPVLALFGPTHPALGFAPRGQFDRVIEVDEFCRPCSLHGATVCYRDQRYCFDRIEPSRVVEEVAGTLARARNLRPALFMDRDGTVIKEKHFLNDPDDVELVDGVAGALARAAENGYRLVVVSNQSGVARGLFTTDDVDRVNGRMLELLLARNVAIDGVYFSPFHPDGSVTEFARTSTTRKPAPGMIERAAEELSIDVRRSIVIGDRRSDLHLGTVIGAPSILVRTGYGAQCERDNPLLSERHVTVCDDLAAAIDVILSGSLYG